MLFRESHAHPDDCEVAMGLTPEFFALLKTKNPRMEGSSTSTGGTPAYAGYSTPWLAMSQFCRPVQAGNATC